jgi:hypothetical protein
MYPPRLGSCAHAREASAATGQAPPWGSMAGSSGESVQGPAGGNSSGAGAPVDRAERTAAGAEARPGQAGRSGSPSREGCCEREGGEKRKKKKKWWVPLLEGEWRASKNGGWEGEFGGVWKIEVCLEALLELGFSTKPPNFGVEAHMEAPTRVALTPPPPPPPRLLRPTSHHEHAIVNLSSGISAAAVWDCRR